MRITHRLLFAALLCGSANWAFAGLITYDVTANTSSISGTTGSIDFNFNPGPLATQPASLQILGFTTDGSLVAGSQQATNDASGTLPGTLTFDNGTVFNDYFQEFTFGSMLVFQVSLYGPALSSPDPADYPGDSTFVFSMFSDTEGQDPVLTTSPQGYALTVDVNSDGTTTPFSYSSQTGADAEAPEPGGLALAGVAMACLGALQLRGRRPWQVRARRADSVSTM
jgi:hypothetical protein